MPASVTTNNLGNPAQSGEIRKVVISYFEGFTGDWTVHIIGDQGNDNWEVKVSDGDKLWREKLGAGLHSVEAVLAVLNEITR